MTFPRAAQLVTVLGRALTDHDAVPEHRLREAERRLGMLLPQSVAAFYRHVGAAPEFQAHDTLCPPEALEVQEGFLVFMEENQGVVDWGLPLPFAEVADPEVWQRVNGDPAVWDSEHMTFSEFVVRRLAFARGVTLNDHLPRPDRA